MPINTDLLVAAPMLQNILVDKDGTPMSGGTITCYRDNNRTTLKNWYYQSGSPGNYTWIRLPNPLTLSAAGTICDMNGVDTIPFFYPYDESDQTIEQPYYIKIVNHDQTNQITRENFPFMPGQGSSFGEGTNDNYIINNRFWRNSGVVNLTNVTQRVVCPSQHDGFQYPDIQFFKDVTGAVDTLTFSKFPLTQTPILTDDITPEFYINHQCATVGVGETEKCYQIPISLHVNTLASVSYIFTIQAQNLGGTAPGQNVIEAYIFQDTGAGTTPPDLFLIGNITLTASWEKYEITGTFPSTNGLTLGQGGDDALYLLLRLPRAIAFNINFALPSIYLNDTAPTNSFATYDQINSVIGTERTGDIRYSLNDFYYFGWVPALGGTIGNTGSIASIRGNTDTWPLYNLLWNLGNRYNVNPNPVAQMFNSSAVAITYGGSAIADFTAARVLQLSPQLGDILMGTAPDSAIVQNSAWNQPVTFSNPDGNLLITAANAIPLYNGQPVSFTGILPNNLNVNTVYYLSQVSGVTARLCTTLLFAYARTPFIPFSASLGTPPIYMRLNPTGTRTGEVSHTPKSDEVGPHVHVANTVTTVPTGLAPGAVGFVPASNHTADIPITSNTGISINSPNGFPFNIVQRSFIGNCFVKL